MAGLFLKNIVKEYSNGFVAVPNFSLDIADDEFVVLAGPSGCGKSTIMRMLAGLEEISDGEMYIGDELMNDVAPNDRGIAMILQNYALYPHLSVYDNMAFGLKLRKIPKDEIDSRVREAAKILDMENILETKPEALSDGQRQRVAIGRAIVRKPKVFLMDEPFSNLDAGLRAQMRAEILGLHQTLQTAFLYATHDQAEAMAIGERVVVIKDGLIQQIDEPVKLYNKPVNLFVAGFIGSPQMNFIIAKVVKSNNDVYLCFGEYKIKASAEKAKALISAGYDGKEIIMGIRPENLHDEEAFISKSPESVINADVEQTGLIGSEAYLYLTLNGEQIIAMAGSPSEAKPGDKIRVAIDATQIHMFDKDSEAAICV